MAAAFCCVLVRCAIEGIQVPDGEENKDIYEGKFCKRGPWSTYGRKALVPERKVFCELLTLLMKSSKESKRIRRHSKSGKGRRRESPWKKRREGMGKAVHVRKKAVSRRKEGQQSPRGAAGSRKWKRVSRSDRTREAHNGCQGKKVRRR